MEVATNCFGGLRSSKWHIIATYRTSRVHVETSQRLSTQINRPIAYIRLRDLIAKMFLLFTLKLVFTVESAVKLPEVPYRLCIKQARCQKRSV